MKIAVEGCAHGELEKIYETLQCIEKKQHIKIDLLLCCGDFQATRNLADLKTMAVPQKYSDICTFYKYYSGELVAPMLTIFVGGNHEASNYLQELPYGGWVAPNIYYLGYAGVVRVNGLRIAGISGIYKGFNYLRGRYECSPYTEKSMRSVYHQRQLEVFRMKQLSGNIDIFMSHDWPRGIEQFGDAAQLIRFKPHFQEDIERNQLGSKPCEELLHKLQPKYWFAAHLHCKFAAVVSHHSSDIDDDDDDDSDEVNDSDNGDGDRKQRDCANNLPRFTKFLALDKCLPKRRFLQVLDIESTRDELSADADVDTDVEESSNSLRLEYDLEWLAILQNTNHLLSIKDSTYYMPGESKTERFNFTPTAEELNGVRIKFANNLTIPKNFCRTVKAYKPTDSMDLQRMAAQQPKSQINPQCRKFCDTLGIDDPLSLLMAMKGENTQPASTLEDTAGSDVLTDTSLLSFDDTDTSCTTSAETSFYSPNTSLDNSRKRKSFALVAPNSGPAGSSPLQAAAVSELSGGTEQLHLLEDDCDEDANEDAIDPDASIDDDDDKLETDSEAMIDDANAVEMGNECALLSINEIHNQLASPLSHKFKRRNETIYNEGDDANLQ